MTADLFVGRLQELKRLRAALDAACAGRGGLVMITSEPRIGKTRQARELESYATEHGARVLRGRAYDTGGAPAYWHWVQALRSLIDSVDMEEPGTWLGGSSEVARIVPELRQHVPGLPEPESMTAGSPSP